MHFSIEHGFENNLARFFGRERLERQLRIAERGRVERIQLLVFAVVAARKSGQGYVERINVLLFVFRVHFHDQRILTLTIAAAHRAVFELDAFALYRFDEFHEGRRAHHRHGLLHVRAEIHAAQSAAERLFGKYVAFRRIRAQPDDGGDIAHIPALFEHQHRDNGLVRTLPAVDGIRGGSQDFKLIFIFAGSGLGDFTVVLGMNDEHCALKFGANLFQMRADFIAVAGVVHHHEQHGFLAEFFVLGVALAPFLDAQRKIVGMFLGEQRAFVLLQLGAARRIRQHRMFDDVLVDRLDQRVIADGLNKNRAVVVARRGGDINLQGETPVSLQHPVMNVLNALEPRHSRVVNVVRFVVEDRQFFDLADNFAKIGFTVGRFANRLRPEGREEIITQVVILQRRIDDITEIDTVDVG